MQPAWKTTEFWATLVSNIVGIIALLGYVSSDQATALTEASIQIAGAVLMIATSFGFVKERSAVRKTVIQAVSFAGGENQDRVRAAIKASKV